jgi:hypothetical protein
MVAGALGGSIAVVVRSLLGGGSPGLPRMHNTSPTNLKLQTSRPFTAACLGPSAGGCSPVGDLSAKVIVGARLVYITLWVRLQVLYMTPEGPSAARGPKGS